MADFYDSFTFGGVNMLERFGIRVICYDLIGAPLRPRKLAIPQRSGAYDFGATQYDERLLRLECDSRSALSRSELRELSYLLSKKQRIVLWDEPDKYYLGRIYDPGEITRLDPVVCELNLNFVCDPFAYAAPRQIDQMMGTAAFSPGYRGTARAPMRIEITNTTGAPVSNIHILIRERSETY